MSDQDADGLERDVEHIIVVCDESGFPHRAFYDEEKAKELLEYWREELDVEGTYQYVDLVEYTEVSAP